MSKDTIKFPCAVKSKGMSDKKAQKLLDKFLELGAKRDEEFSGYDHWAYYGVGEDSKTHHWDELEGFGDNITLYTYNKVMSFADSPEEVTIFTPSVSGTKTREYQVGDKVRVLRENSHHLIPIGSEVQITKVTGDSPKYKTDYDTSACWVCDDEIEFVASSNNNTATLEPIEYEGSSSGETVSNQSVGVSVAITANVSFTVKIKGQEFTLDKDEIQELYVALCSAEGELNDWSLGQ